MDIASIPIGVDFQHHIEDNLAGCHVFLAVIGPKWAGKKGSHRRIDDSEDYVRIEIEAALARGILVIPLLIDRTRMPSTADLPPSLAPLAKRNALRVDSLLDFHAHVEKLIRGIESNMRREPPVAHTPEKARTNSLGMKLVRIEPGEFLMGSIEGQINLLMWLFSESRRASFDDEQPQHSVRITRPFFLGVHQVTQGQYQSIMGDNPSRFEGSDELPVESVSWFDAVQFCNKLSERENRSPCYRIYGTKVSVLNGNGYRLPTEAEWEYACRSGSSMLYPFGDDASEIGEHILAWSAWYGSNSQDTTHPVGQKRPNSWGLYDMLGNVWEWCQDAYDAAYYTNSPPGDPPGPAAGSRRVIRGGSWVNDARFCRPASRDRSTPEGRDNHLGFRVAAVQE
jgi:formylglycine-generating enzyme required for sulfatase activity